jgi:hypothetical protein
MNLDVRLPIGLMFSVFGVVLSLYGLASDKQIYQRSLGINVNLWWGIVMLVFGLVMLWLARGGARKEDAAVSPAKDSRPRHH